MLASAVAKKGRCRTGKGVSCSGAEDTALMSGTRLMAEHIMILIINPCAFRSVQFIYVSNSSPTPPGHDRPLRP
jgi:hypothetical protein